MDKPVTSDPDRSDIDKSDRGIFLRYLGKARESIIWKMDGLNEYDIRRPLTPTGTNLLGTIKHLAQVEVGYFGFGFGQPEAADLLPWDGHQTGLNADMYPLATESRDLIVSTYRKVAAFTDETIERLPLDTQGTVPWWPDDINPVSLHWVIVHMMTETDRHLGQMDILRELLDGAAGTRADVPNMPSLDPAGWQDYFATVEAEARSAAGLAAEP